IRLVENGSWIGTSSPDEEELEMFFHFANNAFIYRLTPSFRPENLPFPYYLRANVKNLQCQVGALHIVKATEEVIDYALVDFLGSHLKPRIYETSIAGELPEDYAMLFAHKALRGNLTHLLYEVGKRGLWVIKFG
ncbi:hypothetical protein AAVH_42295, partial [Aphelenchoides avenae]